MATVSYSFSSTDFFALLALRRVAIPYPLQPATQIDDSTIADRRWQVSADLHDDAPWLRSLGPLVEACGSHRASVDLRYVAGERESGAVVLFDDSDTSWLISCDGETGRAAAVPAERSVAAVVQTLPPKPPASFSPISVPSPLLGALLVPGMSDLERERVARAAGSNLQSITDALASVGVSTGAGQIGVQVRTDAGLVRSRTRITITDGRTGRLLQTVTIGSAGDERTHWAPGSPAAVHRAVAELLTATSTEAFRTPRPVPERAAKTGFARSSTPSPARPVGPPGSAESVVAAPLTPAAPSIRPNR